MWYIILMLLVYVAAIGGLLWLSFWILYRIIVSAVRRGIVEADAEIHGRDTVRSL